MRKVVVNSFSIVLVFYFVTFTVAQKKVDIRQKTLADLSKDFSSSSWLDVVVPAKMELESRGADAIPIIIALLDEDKKVVLSNTADLIYPGAKKFHGHGWIVDYDVDWVSVRAGWLLEDLTFQDFGFREGAIDHDDLLQAVIKSRGKTSIKDLMLPAKAESVKKQRRTLAVKNAKDWWQNLQKPWSRFDALYDGLRSDDTQVQYRIFQWIRNRETKCYGLNPQSFDKFLLPEIVRLSNSDHENIKSESKLLLDDNSKEKWWYKRKLKRDYPDEYATMKFE